MLERTLYFAYGANMHPGQMEWRCPDALAKQAFILRDWELRFYSHATIEQKPGAQVAGVLWEITPECESSLDAFEGFPNYYIKRTWIQDGVQFMFYEMTTPKSGQPSEGYVLDIAESYAFWQLPQKLLTESLHVVA
jgi:gamma-glutamylcyclotransferase